MVVGVTRDKNVENVAFMLGWPNETLNETIALKLSVELQCIWLIFDVEVDIDIYYNDERRNMLEYVFKVDEERIVQGL